MNESEKIDPRELSPLALAFVGDSVLELLVRQRLVEHHRLSAGKLNAERSSMSLPRRSSGRSSCWSRCSPRTSWPCSSAGAMPAKASVGQARLPGGIPCLHRLRVPVGMAVPERTTGACAPAV
ncbi:MAG: ribonuclease III domain-containing protein [Faecalibacterium prausnitzii]